MNPKYTVTTGLGYLNTSSRYIWRFLGDAKKSLQVDQNFMLQHSFFLKEKTYRNVGN